MIRTLVIDDEQPARERLKPGSSGQMECSAQTWAVLGSVASLPSDLAWTPGEG